MNCRRAGAPTDGGGGGGGRGGGGYLQHAAKHHAAAATHCTSVDLQLHCNLYDTFKVSANCSGSEDTGGPRRGRAEAVVAKLVVGRDEARAAHSATQLTTSTATKRNTESCGQPKGHKPTGGSAAAAAGRGRRRGGAPLARAGTPPPRRRAAAADLAGAASRHQPAITRHSTPHSNQQTYHSFPPSKPFQEILQQTSNVSYTHSIICVAHTREIGRRSSFKDLLTADEGWKGIQKSVRQRSEAPHVPRRKPLWQRSD